MKKLLVIAVLLSSIYSASGQNVDNKWGLDLQVGVNEYYGNLENQFFFQSKDPHLFGGIGLNRYLNKSFDLGLNLSGGRWAGSAQNYKYRFSGVLTDLSLLAKFKLNNDYFISSKSKFSPFITAGVGYGYFSKFNVGSPGKVGLKDGAGNLETSVNAKGGNVIIPIGAGVKYNFTKSVALQYQVLFNINLSDAHDGYYDVPSQKKDNFLKQSLTLSFAFGKPKDTDKDGVIDRLDLCAGTPAMVAVTPTGCPVDADGDGVADYLDKCPGTPTGVQVSAEGCPIDTDGDGVVDYLDKCPNDKGLVALNGCPDNDQDGIADKDDACPNTPLKVRVDSKGCPIDSDGDGIADYLDKCPNVKGIKQLNGCPDTDGDGIGDDVDKCPDVKGTRANKGCPEIKQEVKAVFKKALQGIQFETGKDIIKPASNAILDNIADIMKMNPAYKLTINGHTDNVGKVDANQSLSQKRADAVKKYLTDKGVSADRMSTFGYGDTKPVADNATPAGRTQNRRVEFVVEF